MNMISNIQAERAVKRLPHVLSASAPVHSTTMRVAVDFAPTDAERLRAFGDRAARIASAAGYEIAIRYLEPQ
jgi:hypothetical protein